MRVAETLPQTKTGFNHRDWHITPAKDNPNCFDLKTTTGNLLCTLAFPKDCNTSLLNLIASAPELQDIAEMFRDKMKGNEEEKTMIFAMVMEVLQRIHPQ